MRPELSIIILGFGWLVYNRNELSYNYNKTKFDFIQYIIRQLLEIPIK